MTNKLTIISNYHRRDILYWHELTDQERAELDWIEEKEADEYTFFRFKDDAYCLSEFMRTNGHFPGGWDGYANDSFFSGILIKYPVEDWGDIDTDHIIVGWYLS